MILSRPSMRTVNEAIVIHKGSFGVDELAPTSMFLYKFHNSVTFVETDGDILKGYLIVVPSFKLYPSIWEVAVAQKYRRQGVAGRLLDEAIQWTTVAEEAGLELTVREANRAAIELYESRGFRAERFLKNFYPTGNGLLMKKELRREI